MLAAEERAERGAAAEHAAAHDGRSLAVVLADRTSQVERAYAAAFPVLGQARRSTMSGTGFAAGAAAGERADLGHGAVAAQAPRAIGA